MTVECYGPQDDRAQGETPALPVGKELPASTETMATTEQSADADSFPADRFAAALVSGLSYRGQTAFLRPPEDTAVRARPEKPAGIILKKEEQA